MTIIEAIIIAIVEGLTEFLPISSTGHMIIAERLLGVQGDFVKLFTVSIQLGAILAVVVLYWRKFFNFSRWQFYLKLMAGVLPALVLGYLFSDKIDDLLESPLTVAITMLVGGVVLLFVDRLFQDPLIKADEGITYKKSFIIGCWQVLAMVPGVSRSAASIIGGMQQRLSRGLAAEFSFFLAVPTMFAASAYSLFLRKWNSDGTELRGYELIAQSSENMYAFVTGNIVAFIVAVLAIKIFIGFLKRYGFWFFGLYRILVGFILLLLIVTGYLK